MFSLQNYYAQRPPLLCFRILFTLGLAREHLVHGVVDVLAHDPVGDEVVVRELLAHQRRLGLFTSSGRATFVFGRFWAFALRGRAKIVEFFLLHELKGPAPCTV